MNWVARRYRASSVHIQQQKILIYLHNQRNQRLSKAEIQNNTCSLSIKLDGTMPQTYEASKFQDSLGDDAILPQSRDKKDL